MDSIREKHHGLINGLTKLYDTFVTMQYISASDVMYPPHTDPEVAITRLQGLGFEKEVLDLVQILPGLRNEVTWGWQEEGIELIPRSKAVNYFISPDDAGDDLIDDLRRGDFSKFKEAVVLHPWMLRLTDGSDHGTHLIYNTRDLFSEIQANLDSLEWVPYYDPFDENTPPHRRIEENPITFQNMWAGDGGMHLRREINFWKAQQTLYRDSGWDSAAGFDGEMFRIKKLDFITKFRDLEDQRFDLSRGPPQTEEQRRRVDELNQRYNEFLTEAAGENAV